MVSASGSAAEPSTTASATPKSRAKLAKFDTTIRPPVAIIVIMANISQKIGERSISRGVAPALSSAPERTSLTTGSRRNNAARRPMPPSTTP